MSRHYTASNLRQMAEEAFKLMHELLHQRFDQPHLSECPHCRERLAHMIAAHWMAETERERRSAHLKPNTTHLKPEEAAAYCGTTPAVLGSLRYYGKGPEFQKSTTSGRISYSVEALDRWLKTKSMG